MDFKDNYTVCYCFGYTKRDIEDDFIKNGKSTIMEKIAYEKSQGRCNCVENNPKGK